jgi:hypothetical protein
MRFGVTCSINHDEIIIIKVGNSSAKGIFKLSPRKAFLEVIPNVLNKAAKI